MATGDIIRTKREAKGMTQKQLADAVGVAPSFITQIERGTKSITLALAKQVAVVLECSVAEL